MGPEVWKGIRGSPRIDDEEKKRTLVRETRSKQGEGTRKGRVERGRKLSTTRMI